MIDPDADIGPTLIVILTASICEYLHMSPISPLELLRGMSQRVPRYSGTLSLPSLFIMRTQIEIASVQDACLLSMLRVSADCDEVPSDIVELINQVHGLGGRHIKRVR